MQVDSSKFYVQHVVSSAIGSYLLFLEGNQGQQQYPMLFRGLLDSPIPL